MASKGAIGARHADVRGRLQAGMERLSQLAGVPLPDPVSAPIRQPDLRAVAELERVAEFLERLAQNVQPAEGNQSPEPAAAPVPSEPPAEDGGMGADETHEENAVEEDDPVIHGHPLSFYAGKTDAQILGIRGVGAGTLKKIRDAQAERE